MVPVTQRPVWNGGRSWVANASVTMPDAIDAPAIQYDGDLLAIIPMLATDSMVLAVMASPSPRSVSSSSMSGGTVAWELAAIRTRMRSRRTAFIKVFVFTQVRGGAQK